MASVNLYYDPYHYNYNFMGVTKSSISGIHLYIEVNSGYTTFSDTHKIIIIMMECIVHLYLLGVHIILILSLIHHSQVTAVRNYIL